MIYELHHFGSIPCPTSTTGHLLQISNQQTPLDCINYPRIIHPTYHVPLIKLIGEKFCKLDNCSYCIPDEFEKTSQLDILNNRAKKYLEQSQSRTAKMYERYQNLWKGYCLENMISKDEVQ